MAGDTDNPRIWLGADVYVGPVGSTAPTDTTTALDAAFKALGLLSEDGMTEKRDQDSNDFYAWGGVLVRNVRSKFKRSFTVTALEDNAVVWALVNPGSTAATATGTTTRTVKNPSVNPQAFIIETVDGDVTRRIVIPKGEVTEIGDVKADEKDMTGYELTITVYPASDGTLYKELTDAPGASVTAP